MCALVLGEVPVGGVLFPLEQAHLAAAGFQYARSTLVPLARARTSASPNGPLVHPYCSNQAEQNWVSLSKLPDSGLRYSVMERKRNQEQPDPKGNAL
ncbi:hypothetical protein [Thiolapillus sp.]|uniref:hypothetical protein n=1 Tax=Thiolapillus sp. TaxID=2017437 RepID=UPI003AF4A699